MVVESDGFPNGVIRGSHGHFAPGTAGGPGRMPKDLSVTERIKRRMLLEADAIAERVVQTLLDPSTELNVRLLEMSLNRIEGVAKQTLQLEGASSGYGLLLEALVGSSVLGGLNDTPTPLPEHSNTPPDSVEGVYSVLPESTQSPNPAIGP